MTISSSLNASVAGLAANASRLDTISDNIANSATHGYRRVQTDFHSMVIAAKGDTYSARLVPYDGETEMDHQSVYAYHSVNEVSMQNGQAVLGLTDGNYIYTDIVTALRL
jgi:flagellar hook protein FlgE